MSADQLHEIAERVLSRVGTDAEAEITVTAGTESLTRFATSFIHQNVADEARAVSLRLSLDGRVTSASANQTDDDALDRLVRSATDAARLRPVDPGWSGLAPPAAAPSVDHWDDATAAADPASRAQRVRAFVDAAGGLETAGYCATEGVMTAFANSAGQRLSGRATTAAMNAIARSGTSEGSGRA
ncbi:MAG: PmbA/TldA family metallopeptidase, partial [Candidatus Limnocylindria bacterium]